MSRLENAAKTHSMWLKQKLKTHEIKRNSRPDQIRFKERGK
jgi:hypothetical protein